MANKPTPYLAYLLRLWRSSPRGNWRASLENPQTGERLGFGSLDAVFDFLDRRTQEMTTRSSPTVPSTDGAPPRE